MREIFLQLTSDKAAALDEIADSDNEDGEISSMKNYLTAAATLKIAVKAALPQIVPMMLMMRAYIHTIPKIILQHRKSLLIMLTLMKTALAVTITTAIA